MAVKKSRKRSGFVVHSHFKDGEWGTFSLRNGKKRARGHSRPQSPSLHIKPRGSGDKNGYGLDLGAEPSRKILLLNTPQVAQARNMSIGEHRHCCVTFEI